MVKVYGLTPEGLLPSKALGQVQETASTAAAREAQGVRVVAESAAERVGDLAAPVAKASLTAAHELAAGSPDIREALQSALDGAKHGSDADYWGFLRRLGTKVTVAPGVYRVSARADGYPSVVVPRGVALDFSGATFVFEYPKTATTQWSGILAHSQAVLTVGKMRTVGAAPDSKDVYDAVRFYQGDNGNTVAGDGGVVSNFQGAGFRLLGTYVTRIRGIRVEFCSHGVVHGHSSGLVNDGQGPYAVPAGSGEAVGATRRPTDLWLQDMIFDSTRGDVIVVGAVGSQSQPNVLDWSKQSITGGNLYLNHVLIEGTPARAVWARALSQVVLNDVHLEEVGAPQGAMIDTDVVYGNIVAGPMRINITGSRQSQNLAKQPAYATPAGIFQVGGFQSFSCTDMYIRNDLGDLYFSGPEPWDGAWGDWKLSGITVDLGSSGTLKAGGILPADNFRGTAASDEAVGDPRIANAVSVTDTAKLSEASYLQMVATAKEAARGVVVFETSFEDTAQWVASYGSWVMLDSQIAFDGQRYMRLPANNSNTATGKPVHMYGKQDVPVQQGRKYMIRARLRTMGAVGDTDTFQVLLAKAAGASQTFWLVSNRVNLKTLGVGPDGWVLAEIAWTATETTTLRLGPQGTNLVSDLLVDSLEFADVTTVTDMSADVAAAKALWDTDKAAAVAAWSAILPDGVGGGGSATVSVTRAEYDALQAAGKLNPNTLYMVIL